MAVSLRLPDDISSRLSTLAERTGRSKTFYMIEAIREHLDDLDDLYVAEQRMVEIRAGRSQSSTLDEVENVLAWLIELDESALTGLLAGQWTR